MHKFQSFVLVAVLSLTAAGLATASDFDGSSPLICVPTDIMSCHGAADCGRMTAEEVGIPQFLHLDFKSGTMSGVLETGEERKASFKVVSNEDNATILQGAQPRRAFSILIDHEHGEMSAAIAGDEGGIMILGACMKR